MLRQALDAANQKQPQINAASPPNKVETDPLLPPDKHDPNYATAEDDLDVSESNSFDPDEAYDIIQNWEDDKSEPESSLIEKTWNNLKDFVWVVVNVDNLWDSPTARRSGKNKAIVFFWFFILASGYAVERTSFKFLVDRSGPFRLISVQMVAAFHALIIATGMLLSAISKRDFAIGSLGIPIIDVGIMALLDTVHMLLVFITGIHVSPTNTIILAQFTLPLTALITQFVHADGCTQRCCGKRNNSSDGKSDSNRREGQPLMGWGGLSTEHILGSIIISLAVLMALCPAIYSIWDPEFFLYADTIPTQTAYNTLLFVSSCIPAAISQIYKEYIFLQYKQPVMMDHLNLILSIFQFIVASIMSPLLYNLQGLAASKDWTSLYPSSHFSKNIMEGFQCFFGTLDEDSATNGYNDEAQCDYSLGLVLFHSFSIIAVGVAVDKIIHAGATKVMYRGVSAGIIFSALLLYIYDQSIPDFSYGSAIDSLTLISLLLLILGSEVYHRVSLQDATFETVYQTIDDFYDQE